ncbi:MAG TPA: zinc-binding dehydrogenase [Povalibacter sp.]
MRSLRAATGGRGADFSIECTADVLREAVDALAPCGTCAMVGVASAATEVAINMGAMLRGRSLRGVTEGDSVRQRFIPQLIQWWRAGRFPFEKLVQYFELSQINAGGSGLCIRLGDQTDRDDAGPLLIESAADTDRLVSI